MQEWAPLSRILGMISEDATVTDTSFMPLLLNTELSLGNDCPVTTFPNFLECRKSQVTS